MELWDAYDREGRPLGGTLIRGQDIPAGQYHLVSCVLVRHEDGSFLVMQRAPEKKICPNLWEIGSGGSVLQGETSREGARRELREETGLDCPEMTFLHRQVEEESRTIFDGYACVTDCPKDSIRLQQGETVDYRWLTPEEFYGFFDSADCIPGIHKRLANVVERLRREDGL